MAQELGKALFGPNDTEKMPMVALPKILEMTNRWDRNRHAIDKGPEQLKGFKIETILKEPVQAPNGLWVVPLQNYDELKKEADALQSCLWGHRMVCLFEGLNVVSIREDINVSGYTAAIIPDLQKNIYVEYRPPSGLDAAHQDITDAWTWFRQEVSNDHFGKQDELIAFAMNKVDMLEEEIDVPSILAGYDIRNKKASQNADATWQLWAQHMDDLLRYRKLNLQEMLARSGLNKKLNQAVDIATP